MTVLTFRRLASAAVALTCVASQALAATEAVTLTASGTIAAAPQWQDGAGADLTSIAFNFGNLIAGSTPASDVDSASYAAKLVNASAYPATVALVRPGTCTIGANNVTNANVHLVFNATAVTSDSNISLPSNANQAFSLRFAAAGNHGSQAGVVACGTSGSLTYTY